MAVSFLDISYNIISLLINVDLLHVCVTPRTHVGDN